MLSEIITNGKNRTAKKPIYEERGMRNGRTVNIGLTEDNE